MDAAGREMQVRKFVEEVWNGRNYQAVFDLYGNNYVNPFGTGPGVPECVPRRQQVRTLLVELVFEAAEGPVP